MDEDGKPKVYSRWPLLLASVVAFSVGIGLNLSEDPSYAIASMLVGLGAASFGAFVYAEGARHRDWLDRHRDRDQPDDQEG